MSAFLYTFHRGLHCLNVDDCLVENGRQLKQIASDHCGGIPIEELSVVHNGRLVTENSKLHLEAGDVCYTTLLLPGGKGGFGSMLRALGAQIEKTTNREACRDLSGRRMRDINDEKKIAEWVSKQADREREKEEKKQARLARRRAMPKHTFDDQSYTEHIQQNSERIEDALQQGLKAASSSTSSDPSSSTEKTAGKRVHPDDEPTTSRGGKKSRMWLGMEELPDSDEDDDDESASSESDRNAEYIRSACTSTDASCSSTRVEPSSSPESSLDDSGHHMDMETESTNTATQALDMDRATTDTPPLETDSEIERTNGDTQALETDREMETTKTDTQALETDTDKVDQRADRTAEDIQETDTPSKMISKQTEHTDNTGLVGSQITEEQSQEKVEFCLDNYNSAEELESLGLECLKEELMTRGLKCGGTLQQRAQRLFATKGVPLDQLDPSFFAKPTGSKKSKGKK